MKQTKIVVSVSDRRCDVDFIAQLFDAGANVVRINTAHATEEGIRTIIRNVRAVSSRLAIMLDTKGPEIRTTGCDNPIEYTTGEQIHICGNPDSLTTHDQVCVTYPNFVADIPVGAHVLFDDGELDMLVLAKDEQGIVAEVQNDGKLGSKKSVNVPGVHVDLPAVTPKDHKNILLAISEDIDFIAHSFVRNKQDLIEVQSILDEHNSDIKIISKIENQEGVDNIAEIIEHSYGIMVARGDLGIEVPIERIPGIQRGIIRKCVLAKKPVIVATQMLHSMINSPRPTRAEVTDIANAIYYRTDALMLSGETASGKYPIEAVKTMAAIAEQAEADKLKENDIEIPLTSDCDVRQFLAHSAIDATEKLNVKGILTDSSTGETARNLAAYRGHNPILAICYKEKLQRWLALSYGISPVYQRDKMAYSDIVNAALRMLIQKGFLKSDDRVAHVSGLSETGTNTLEINKVQDIIEMKMQHKIV